MKVGTPVCLVGTDGFMPPIGSCGVIVEALDDAGDYGVAFETHPCPNPPGDHWYAHSTWLIPLLPLTAPQAEADTPIPLEMHP
jgi:hypothetical protein